MSSKSLPECWGHRGASARFPENTLASFEAAMRDGAEGIESDVHVSKDDVVVMFHDPILGRTTDGAGAIKELNWYGEGGIEHIRTKQAPKQAIPNFTQTVELLMKPENQHIKFNIDVKVQNDPDHLFKLLAKTITAQSDWQTILAPRILLGLWHPRFIGPAKEHLPFCRRSAISNSPIVCRDYFWKDVDTFSMHFASLTTIEGQKFRKDCKVAGKHVMVWTVNEPVHLMEAVRWEVDAILTDHTQTYLKLRSDLQKDYSATVAQYGRIFLWTTPKFYTPYVMANGLYGRKWLEKIAGPFEEPILAPAVIKV